jgi:hypothetical protein
MSWQHASMCWAIALAVAGIMLPAAAAGGEYHVAPSGNDENPGTVERPVRTLNQGVKLLKAGDTLVVRGGLYRESLRSNIPSGTSWDAPVTIQAYPGEKVVLQPPPGSERVLYFDTWNGQPQEYIVIDGLVLDAIHVLHDCVKIDSGAHHLRFVRCEIKNAPNQGVLSSNDTDGSEFLELAVHDNGIREGVHGLYLGGTGIRIEGCRIYNNAGNALRNDGLRDSVIAYNTMHHNGRHQVSPAVEFHGSGNVMHHNLLYANRCGEAIVVRGSGKIYHNTLAGNSIYGIYLANDSALVHVANNIIVGDNATGLMNGGTDPKSVIENNLAFGHKYNFGGNSNAGTWRNNLEADPRFADAARRDYRLAEKSPAIDAAVPLDGLPRDLAGQPRVAGSRPDLGAYEVSSASEPGLRPPEIDAGADQAITMARPTVTLTAIIADALPEQQPVTIRWISRIGPAAVRFSTPDSASTEATFSEPGAYLLQVFAENAGLAAADLVAIYVHPRLPDKGPIRVEAEHMLLEAYGVERAEFASGGQYVWQRSGMTSTLAMKLPLPAGTYDVAVGYFDENDGQTKQEFHLSGEDDAEDPARRIRLEWLYDRDLRANEPSAATAARKLIRERASIKPGDTLGITTFRDKGESAAIDYIEFVPRD